MKGVNTITLNYETVVEAVTEYLAKRMVTPPIVRSVMSQSFFNNSSESNGKLLIEIQHPIEFLQGSKT